MSILWMRYELVRRLIHFTCHVEWLIIDRHAVYYVVDPPSGGALFVF